MISVGKCTKNNYDGWSIKVEWNENFKETYVNGIGKYLSTIQNLINENNKKNFLKNIEEKNKEIKNWIESKNENISKNEYGDNLQKGIEEHNNGNFSGAQKLYYNAIKDAKDNNEKANVFIVSANIDKEKERYDKAIGSLREAEKLDINEIKKGEIYFLCAKIYLEQDDWKNA